MEQVSSTSTNNKRIAKNAVFLYIRMALSTLVSLYTSRVVLQTLGVEDFGIYSLVGGVVVMFQFLNSSLSGATSRFLTFELGKGDVQRLKDTFSTAMMAHLLMAAFVFIVAETVGLWFISTQLVIPEGRMFAAQIVYQCSILSLMVSFTQVPYNASIISHEDMGVFAYIELLSVFLRLGIVFLLMIGSFDKLILYAVLVLSVSITIALIYRIYAIRHYEECHFHFIWKPKILRPMLAFSGWNIYTYASGSIRQVGINAFINIFCGIIYNAASGIATTVLGALTNFSNNVITAFRPQIIKQYAQGNMSSMVKLMINASKYSMILFLALSLPIFFELPYILRLWLVVVPDKTVEFIRILLVSVIPFTLYDVIIIGIHASGNIKAISIILGTLNLLLFIPSYFLLYLGFNVESVYYCFLVFRCINLIAVFIVLKKQMPEFPLKLLIKEVTLNLFFISSIVICLIFFINSNYVESFSRFIVSCCISFILYGLYTFYFVIDKSTRARLRTKINNYVKVKLRK